MQLTTTELAVLERLGAREGWLAVLDQPSGQFDPDVGGQCWSDQAPDLGRAAGEHRRAGRHGQAAQPATAAAASNLPELLREVFRAAGGTHDDWPTYDRVMAEERRAVILIHPKRSYGNHRS